MQHAIAALDTHDLLGRIDMETLDTADARGTHATGDNGSVARLATVTGQDALGGDHTLQVVGVGLPADQNDLMALGRTRDGIIAREHDLAHGGTGTGVKAACERLVLLGGVELRVQELVELRGFDAAHGLLTRDEALLDHLDSDAQSGGCGTLAHAGLKHPELTLLDGELDVAHVAVVILEASGIHAQAPHLRTRGPEWS